MATDRQIAANRRNALKSTGPRTAAGKANSSRNALWHGLTAQKMFFLDGEDPKEYETFRCAVYDHLQPVGPLEEETVDSLADAYWQQRRCPRFEPALFDWVAFSESKQLPGYTRKPQLTGEEPRHQQKVLGRVVEYIATHDYLGRMSRHEKDVMGKIERLQKRFREEQKARLEIAQITEPACTLPAALPDTQSAPMTLGAALCKFIEVIRLAVAEAQKEAARQLAERQNAAQQLLLPQEVDAPHRKPAD